MLDSFNMETPGEDIVQERLAVVRRLVDGPEASDDAAFVPSSAEELRRRVSGCLRLAARQRMGSVEAAEVCSEVISFMKSWFEAADTLRCGEVLDQFGAACGHWLDYGELVEVVDGLAINGRVSFAAVKDYIVNSKGEHLIELVARVRRIIDAAAEVFSRLCAKRKSTISVSKMHRFIYDRIQVDLTKDEVLAVLRTMNELAGAAENGPEVDKGAFLQFVKTESVVKKLRQNLAKPVPAVVDMRVAVSRLDEDNLRGQGYEPVADPTLEDGSPCDLLHGGGARSKPSAFGWGSERVSLWLLRARETRLPPIVDARFEASSTNSALAVIGYTCLTRNLGRRGATPRYLWIARARGAAVTSDEDIVDVQITVGRADVVDNPIHLSPGWAFERIRGEALGGAGRSSMRDVYVWIRPRQRHASHLNDNEASAPSLAPAAAYARWSPHRRRLECEMAVRHATRVHAPPTATGAPDLCGLFFRHATSAKLGKRDFGRLMRDVGFNLECVDRDVLMSRLAVSSNAESAKIDMEDFRSFFSLADQELDQVAADLKRWIRKNNAAKTADPVSKILDQLQKISGSANVTLAELGAALRYVGHFLTSAEISRLAKRWTTPALDGEIDADAFLRYLESPSTPDDDARRSAARVQIAADALRTYILDAPQHHRALHAKLSALNASASSTGGSASLFSFARQYRGSTDPTAIGNVTPAETAWAALTHKRAQRLRRFAGLPLMLSNASKTKHAHRLAHDDDRAATEALSLSSSSFLEADDLALAVERQLPFSGNARLSPAEYGQLVSVIGPTSDHIKLQNLSTFAETPFRPIAELIRLIDHRLLRVCGDLVALYRAAAQGDDVVNSTAEYRACLFETVTKLGLVDTHGFPRRMPLDKLRRHLCTAAAAATVSDKADGALGRVSLAEWCSLAQHAAADVERPFFGGATSNIRAVRVDARDFVEGLCRLVAGDDSIKASLLPILRPGAKNERRFSIACRDIARCIEKRDLDDHGEWLRKTLAVHGLPTDVPAPLSTFKRLLESMSQDFGWGLDADHIDMLARAIDPALVGGPQLAAFLERQNNRHRENRNPRRNTGSVRFDEDDGLDAAVQDVVGARDIVGLERIFQSRDPENLGTVACPDFLNIASRLGLWSRIDEIVDLAHQLDRRGRVDYICFCRSHVAPRLFAAAPRSLSDNDQDLRRLVQPIAAALGERQRKNGLDIALPFKFNDPDNSGSYLCVSE